MTTATAELAFLDNRARIHVDGRTSRDAYGLVEMTGPRGDMPPLHVHRREDEAFYVLDGRLTVFVGDEAIDVRAGESAFAPRGVPHAYRVESESARWLAIASPSGFEAFVREVAEGAIRDPRRLSETAASYGIDILGPPGALPAAS